MTIGKLFFLAIAIWITFGSVEPTLIVLRVEFIIIKLAAFVADTLSAFDGFSESIIKVRMFSPKSFVFGTRAEETSCIIVVNLIIASAFLIAGNASILIS